MNTALKIAVALYNLADETKYFGDITIRRHWVIIEHRRLASRSKNDPDEWVSTAIGMDGDRVILTSNYPGQDEVLVFNTVLEALGAEERVRMHVDTRKYSRYSKLETYTVNPDGSQVVGHVLNNRERLVISLQDLTISVEAPEYDYYHVIPIEQEPSIPVQIATFLQETALTYSNWNRFGIMQVDNNTIRFMRTELDMVASFALAEDGWVATQGEDCRDTTFAELKGIFDNAVHRIMTMLSPKDKQDLEDFTDLYDFEPDLQSFD